MDTNLLLVLGAITVLIVVISNTSCAIAKRIHNKQKEAFQTSYSYSYIPDQENTIDGNLQPQQKENPFGCPLGMPKYRDLPNGAGCFNACQAYQQRGSRPQCTGKDVPPAGPIIPVSCNKVPVWQPGMQPQEGCVPDMQNCWEQDFPALTKATGKFTFSIPQLRYDGIWSMKDNQEDPTKCSWTLQKQPKECLPYQTYGGNKLSPAPECSMFGKTIIAPPECAGLWPTSSPPITYNYDCLQDVPCHWNLCTKCPTRV